MLKRGFSGIIREAGCDEAGRGCLAGPVLAAAVILPSNINIPGLDDSKKLSQHKREALEPQIKSTAIAFGIGIAGHHEIDKINILQASILAMHRALQNLQVQPEFIIVDGNRFRPYGKIPHQTIVKGDSLYQSIAAASVLAKTERDRIMEKLDSVYPEFGWSRNKGYPTAEHRAVVSVYGPSPFHRKSFRISHPIMTKLEL